MPKIKSKVSRKSGIPPNIKQWAGKSQKSKVISNRNIKDNYFEIIVEAPAIAKSALPGQFVNIKVSDGIEPLLRRPLSIHRISHQVTRSPGHQSKAKRQIVMLYEVVGEGTEILSRRTPGEFLDVIGPLGSGFRFDHGLSTMDYRPILVAGGMGTAPLVFLAEEIKKSQSHKVTKSPILVLLGAKTKDSILCEKEFKELGCEVKIATDDGSRGLKGYVSELLKQELSTIDYRLSTIYACGPTPLLKEISRISLERNIPAQLSLESHMACGIGACMGCVIKVTRSQSQKVTRDFEYQRVCKEGPVFEAREIIWQ